MNSSSGTARSATSPVAIFSACSAFHFSTASLSDATSSALLMDSGGVNSPVPVTETDVTSTSGIAPTLTNQPTQVRTSDRSESIPSPFDALTHTMSP